MSISLDLANGRLWGERFLPLPSCCGALSLAAPPPLNRSPARSPPPHVVWGAIFSLGPAAPRLRPPAGSSTRPWPLQLGPEGRGSKPGVYNSFLQVPGKQCGPEEGQGTPGSCLPIFLHVLAGGSSWNREEQPSEPLSARTSLEPCVASEVWGTGDFPSPTSLW